ncbi:hypothetical protein [Pseudonocardia acaciae]|uniref:hypothetical protein n=1 Tax=Pseudonocardia acaciae TaxID=551276 RepID=UPI00048FA143|nr:hypothetical protein [Pseudonocardia acaciae]
MSATVTGITGAVMLAVPAVLGAPVLTGVPLAVGAVAVALAVARPRGAAGPAAVGVAVACAAVALVTGPPEPMGAGLCGLAALAFLLAARWHRQATATTDATTAPGAWLAAHRPMLVGAAVTTPAAIAAATVSPAWSIPVGAVLALLATAVFRPA